MKAREGDGDSGQTWDSEDSGQLGDAEDRGQLGAGENSGHLGDIEDRGEREERIVDIYESADRGDKEERLVDIYESVDQFGVLPGPQGDTGDNAAGRQTQGQRSKTMRRHLIEKVCLGMLCVLLLVVIIVRESRPADNSSYNQLLDNLTQTLTRFNNLTLERKDLEIQLKRETTDHSTHNQLVHNLTQERDGLQRKVQNLALERDGLQSEVRQLKEQREDHSTHNQLVHNLTQERDGLKSEVQNLTLERDGLQSEVRQLKEQREVNPCPDGWLKFACSCYYKSTEKTWEESRKECLEKGADLVIINNDVEQEFISGLNLLNGQSYESWIGLNKTGGNWTWVDGTPLTTAYWASEDSKVKGCAVYSYQHGTWNSAECAGAVYTGICEKS